MPRVPIPLPLRLESRGSRLLGLRRRRSARLPGGVPLEMTVLPPSPLRTSRVRDRSRGESVAAPARRPWQTWASVCACLSCTSMCFYWQDVPGIAEMQALVAQVGRTLPYEARVWWGWRDAVPRTAGSAARAVCLFRWLPSSEAVQACVKIRKLIADSADDDPRDPEQRWSSRWLPLVSGGGSVVIDTDVPDRAPAPCGCTGLMNPTHRQIYPLSASWCGYGSRPSASVSGASAAARAGRSIRTCVMDGARPQAVWSDTGALLLRDAAVAPSRRGARRLDRCRCSRDTYQRGQ